MHSDTPGQPAPEKGEAPGHDFRRLTTTTTNHIGANQDITASRQVSWHPVYEYINRLRRCTGALDVSAPLLGTPAWCDLNDDHPGKLAAVLNAAEGAAYTANVEQTALGEASKAVSCAADWSAIARRNRERADFIAANPWARRVVDDDGFRAPRSQPRAPETAVENGAEKHGGDGLHQHGGGQHAEDTAMNPAMGRVSAA